jgi:hypothetical protein
MRILLRDLTPGTDYSIQLRANDGINVSDWSRIFALSTTTDTLAPAQPQNLTWDVNQTGFSAKWDAVTQNADASPLLDLAYYIVRIAIPSSTSVDIQTTNNFYDLSFEANIGFFSTAQAELECTVFSVDTTGNISVASTTETATNPAPPDPTGVAAAGVVGGVSMKWDVQTIDDLAAYDVHMSTSGSGFTPSGGNRVYSGTSNTFIFDSSSLGVVHYFKIASRDVFGSLSNYVTVSATPISPTDVDTTAPDVPTSLSASMAVDANDSAFAKADFSWTAPADTDLAGYIVRYKQNASTTYDFIDVPLGTVAVTIGGLVVGIQYNFSVQAYDRSTNRSAFATAVNATAANTAPSTPKAPTAVAGVQNIQVSHDLEKATTGRLEADVAYFEVHLGTTSTFTASSATLIGQMQVEPGTTFVSGVFSTPVVDSSVARWVRVIAVDRGGLTSSPSAVAAVTVGLIDNANISNATITSAKINDLAANKITAGTGIINALLIKASLTVDTAGTVESSNYSAGAAGYRLSNKTLEINGGTIRAAALQLQNGHNMLHPAYTDFEFLSTWYSGNISTSVVSGTLTATIVDTVTITPKYGIQCLRLVRSGGSAGDDSDVWLGASSAAYNVPVEQSTTYIFSVWIHNSTTAKNIQLKARSSDGTFRSFDTMSSRPANGAWTRYSGTLTTGAYNAITIGLSTETDGTIYFDGLQLEPQLAGSTSPSTWKPPSQTSIDGGIIRTGEIRSTALANGLAGQPAWSINVTGAAQFGDATVRGRIVVGDPSNPTADGSNSRIHSANYSAGTAGWIINNDGSAEFNNVTVRGGSSAGNYVIVGPSGGQQVRLGSTGSSGFVTLTTGRPIEIAFSAITSSVGNSGAANEYAYMQMLGPTVSGATGQVSLRLNSQNNDGTSNANASLTLGVSSIIIYDKDQMTISTPVLYLQNASSSSPVIRVNAAGGHTGSLLQLQQSSSEKFAVDTAGNTTISGVDIGRGPISSVQITSNVTGIASGTETNLMTVPSMTFKDGRAYRLHINGMHESGAANDRMLYRVRKGSASTSGTLYLDALRVPTSATAGLVTVVNMSFILENNSGADITTALSVNANPASGTASFQTATTNRAFATVEDVGVVGSWSGVSIT